ncbi:MAG: hypothetical protein LC775_09050 [Acidobacteria bacterium]|nr:hypothetical protein [Acidobacteriota bacterium]
MPRSTLWPLLSRIVAVIAGLFLLGILLQLIGQMLSPVLPPALVQALGAGWQLLYLITGPALPAVMAIVILGALLWIFIGRR